VARFEINTNKTIVNAVTKGTWLQALADLRENLADARRRGDLQNTLNLISALVFVMLDMDFLGEQVDYSEIEAALQEVLAAPDQGFGKEVWSRSDMIRVYARQARFNDAHRLMDELHELFSQPQSIHEKQALLWAEAELAASEKRWEDALIAYKTFVNNLTILDHGSVIARSLLPWAEVLLARGQPDDLILAQHMLQEAQKHLERMGAEPYVAYVHRRLQDLRTATEAQVIENRKIALELAQAGRIQASFLPETTPRIHGWSLAAVLEPARQTSGDYYDFIPLSSGRLGILVADVADKGAAAALFMASSRTLIRTYAREFPDRPEFVIQAANRQLLGDTHSGLFVTLFYGVLDPADGSFTYCNAGHNPPYVINSADPGKALALTRTGTALGIIQETTFASETIQLRPGDILLMFTDGITEAQSAEGSFYGEERLQDLIRACLRVPASGQVEALSAQKILDCILVDLHDFTQNMPRSDDMTLICLMRNPTL
jgi:serine phosphatase RsbU (regulator of sigma subunit)